MNIFKRIEKKYLLNDEQYNLLIEKIKEHLCKDAYYQSTISNIYFDNDNFDMIINSIEKPPFKEKVRIRSYQTPQLNDNIFLETKIKYKDVVYKRRVIIKLDDFYNYLQTGKLPDDSQIMKEIDYKIKKYNLKPKMFLAYDRLSYYDKNNINFRITFDQNIRSRDDDLRLENGDYGKFYFSDNTMVMEIKTLDSLPLWFTKVLADLKIYPISFSKYGSIYTKKLKEEKIYV